MNNLELELEDFTLAQLESCSYRYLQKVTKSMNLPSNFKKIYLIEMIRAKRYGTPEALEKIITRVREERIANSLLKKQQRRMKLQNTENTSALEQQLRSLSPVLTTTPKHRPSYVAKYRNTHPIAKYSQRTSIHQSCVRRPDFDGVLRPMCLKKSESDKVLNLECGNTTESDKVLNLKCGNTTESDQVLNLKCGHTTESDKVLSPTFKSDRVLRSCNIRVKPAYTHLNIPIVNAVNNRNDTLQYSHVKKFKLNTYQIANPIRVPAFNVKNDNAQTHKVYFGRSCQREKQKNVEERRKIDVPNSNPRPAKRQRLTSSISPIKLGESYESPRMYYRRKDGTITKINVIRSTEKNVYKKRAAKMATEDVQSCCVSIQDIINYNVNKSTKQPRKERQDPRSVTQKENVETYIKSRVLVEKLNENAMIESETLIQSKKTNYGLESAECSFTETRIFNPEVIISSTETHFERNTKFNNITPNDYNNQVHAENASIRNERYIQTKYPNMSALTDYPLNYTLANLNSNTQDEFSLYYHSKYGAAQTISQGNAYNPLAATSSYGTLPNISEVFNQFNNAQYAQCKDYTQPLYVHVSQESEILPIRRLNKDGSVLESIYNYKNQYISREPVLQIAKPMNTTYVFSTPTIATAVAHQSVGPMPQHNSYQQREEEIYNEDNDFMPRLYDCLRMVEQDITMSCDEGLSSMNSCISQEETNDMVEDALELISQDGDYMERIQMDMKMQCIICDWAGPRHDLEIHILREHESQIMESNQTQCVVSFPISILWSLQALHRIVKLQQNLYVLTGFCLPSDCFVAVLSALPTEHEELPTYGTLTVYNKVTKEAFQWNGEIPQISETIPYETELNGLKLDITSLDLLPNIPDLKLVNGDLISNSTSEVVICKSELENININVNVQVFDWM